MRTDSVNAGLVCSLMLSHEGMLGGCHLPMTNVYRERLENGLEVLYWGLECSVGRFIDVYVLDKRKPLLRGLCGTVAMVHQIPKNPKRLTIML